MNNDDKILKQLEALQVGLKVLQTDVTAVKGEVEKIPVIEKQLAMVNKEVSKIAGIEKQLVLVSNEVSKIPGIEKRLVQMSGEVSKIPGIEKRLVQMSGEVSKIPGIEKRLVQMSGEVSKIPGIENQLDQRGKQLDQQGKLLAGLASNTATFLIEQQAQRDDIRSLHTEIHLTKEELKDEIVSARTEAKADIMDLKAAVTKRLNNQGKRIEALEEDADITRPDKN